MASATDLFERYHGGVFRLLRRLSGSPDEAEELAQEVFLRVVRALPAYEERRLERAWVFRIARNVWLDRCRARGRAPSACPIDEARDAEPGMQTLRVALDQALSRLGEAEREAFLLREVAGLGYEEIAAATGATPDAARSRIHRARVALRQALGPLRTGSFHGS
jgi:RNA polymerase sigma-70 factor (ECF subfamily)